MKGLAWLGIPAGDYAAAVRFFGETLGLEVAFDAGNTVTSGQGREFAVVLILGMDEKHVPDYRSLNDPEKLQEDRRKFCVSVTRARDEVTIFYSGFVEGASGSPSYAGPSRFLNEIGLLALR